MIATFLVSFAMTALAAPEVEPPSLAQKQVAQERVRAMARQLIGGVLEIQLTQLKENGLTELPIYAEIGQMRTHLDELVDREMAGVVALFAKAEDAPAQKREGAFLEAHQKSRQIVVAMLIERQSLLRRLRIAEMAAQVLRLISLQSTLLETTNHLPEQAQLRREPMTLRAIEDQLDVGAIYGRLKESLDDVSHWPGDPGRQATEGLRLLGVGHVDDELKKAEQHLRNAAYTDSATSQQAVIHGLEALLEEIKKAQGNADATDHKAAEEAIQRMLEQQKELHEETKQADLQAPQADKLVNRQNELAKQLAQLAKQSAPEQAKTELAKAEAAAREAAAKLFEQKREEALAEQKKVMENLKRAAEEAKKAEPPPQVAQKAAEMSDPAMKDLEAAKKDLEEALKAQEKVSAAAKEKPAEARPKQEQVAQQLAKVPQNRQLPEKVRQKTEEARQQAHESAKKMDQAAPVRQQASRQTEQAIERALAETEKALNDAKREQLAARQRDLEQAAQDLDKAAAQERDVAQQAHAASQAKGLEKTACPEAVTAACRGPR